MIKYRFAKTEDTENIIKTLYDIWLNKKEGSHKDALEVSEGFAYYYRNFPEYLDNRVVVAEDDNKIVGLAGVIEHPMPSLLTLKAAQLNPVGVLKEYRGQSIARGCSEFLCKHLKENGYSLFMVCGTPSFYPKLGYYAVFSEHTVSIKTNELKNLTQHCTIVNANKDNLYHILDIYNKAKKDNLFAIERTTQWLQHKFLVNESYPIGTIDIKNTWIALEGNTPIGYVILQPIGDILFVEEFLTLNDKATTSLLSTLKNIAEHGNITC
jgi:predicted acetyltransferase